MEENNQKLEGTKAAYFMELLFEKETASLETDELCALVTKYIDEVEIFFDSKELHVFMLKNYRSDFTDGKEFPVGVSISGFMDFKAEDIGEMELEQYRYQGVSENLEEVLTKCKKKILLGDWMAATLKINERCKLLQSLLDVVVKEIPGCIAVRFPSSGRLLTIEECLNNPWEEHLAFINGGISFRFYNVSDSDTPQFLADTLGLYAIGLPDIQCHFHTLDPNEVVEKLMDVACYLYEYGDIINDDETVPGLEEDEKWICVREQSLVPPYREVLDLNAGRFAAGR